MSVSRAKTRIVFVGALNAQIRLCIRALDKTPRFRHGAAADTVFSRIRICETYKTQRFRHGAAADIVFSRIRICETHRFTAFGRAGLQNKRRVCGIR